MCTKLMFFFDISKQFFCFMDKKASKYNLFAQKACLCAELFVLLQKFLRIFAYFNILGI